MTALLRQPYWDLNPEAIKLYRDIHALLEKGPLGRKFVELINLRISQINGCAYCLKLHSNALREEGESNERLDELAGWRISSHFTAREAAALGWAESVTDIARTHAPDEDYLPLKEHFSDKEITDLTFVIITMNALNRLAASMRK